MSSPPSPGQSTRKRSTRACDQCRKSKTRCNESESRSETCNSCFLSGTQCTFLRPNQKRGPPKGYLNALESRLQEAEALLGVIISSSDQRARTLIQDLSRDTLACGIIKRVTTELYAQEGKDTVQFPHSSNGIHTPHSVCLLNPFDEKGRSGDVERDIVFTSPSHNWQEQLDRYVATGRHSLLETLSGVSSGDPSPTSPTGPDQSAFEVDGGATHMPITESNEMYDITSPYSEDEPNEGFSFPPLGQMLESVSMPIDTGQVHHESHENFRCADVRYPNQWTGSSVSMGACVDEFQPARSAEAWAAFLSRIRASPPVTVEHTQLLHSGYDPRDSFSYARPAGDSEPSHSS